MTDSTRPPNLLFIFTDQQRQDTLACYGNEQIEMPHVNRLAEQSAVFDAAYVTQPVCTPSRSSLMSGLYPHCTGASSNNMTMAVPALPELLTEQRWATGYHGKWHLGDEIFAQHGFEDWRAIEDDMYLKYFSPGRDRNARSHYHHWLVDRGHTPAKGTTFTRGETARFPEADSKPAYLAEEACRFLDEHAHEPFILYTSLLEPHSPFFGPRDDQYDPDDVPLPANYHAPPGEGDHLKSRYLHEHWMRNVNAGSIVTESDCRELKSRYWGLCSQVDTHVGRILDHLESLGLAENTIVVYTSDHGEMMGSHQLLTKCVMYEEAVKIPLLIRLPGQRHQTRVRGPVSQIDLVPTLLDLLGQPVPEDLHGRSRAAELRTGEDVDLPDDGIVVCWNDPCQITSWTAKSGLPEWATPLGTHADLLAADADAVRTWIGADGWKFNASPLGQHELFDLNTDPLETRNLAGDPVHRPRMRRLLERIRDWQARTDDTVVLPALA